MLRKHFIVKKSQSADSDTWSLDLKFGLNGLFISSPAICLSYVLLIEITGALNCPQRLVIWAFCVYLFPQVPLTLEVKSSKRNGHGMNINSG